ncbi:MAG: hypothetical protein IJP14_03630 [Clostridia bacterium]|nr:hypothetical protein [Clostridia bacterium]
MAAQHHRTPSFLVIQCAIGGVVLLLALTLRLIGGAWYDSARDCLRDLFMDNAFSQTVYEWVETVSHV